MKKAGIVFTVLVLCLQWSLYAAEGNGEEVGMPNPVVEYASLEEINSLIGVALMRPAVMGVTNEAFSVIGGIVARYDCEVNGMEWSFSGAYITDEDISGICDERNEFEPGQDHTLYTDAFYLERFFDGDRQYTITVMTPVSAEGEILLTQEAFSNICTEFEAIQKRHTDDPLVGDYLETVNGSVSACVERHGDVYSISVSRSDPGETRCWVMYNAVREDGRLTYLGEEISHSAYDAEGNELSCDMTAADNIGWFEIGDGGLIWSGAAQEECRAWVFEKLAQEE